LVSKSHHHMSPVIDDFSQKYILQRLRKDDQGLAFQLSYATFRERTIDTIRSLILHVQDYLIKECSMSKSIIKPIHLLPLVVLFSLLFILFCTTGFGAPVVLKEDRNLYMIGNQIEFLEDKEQKLTIEDIAGIDAKAFFQKSEKIVPRFGFTSSAYWFHIAVRNPSPVDKRLFIEIANSYVDRIDFYQPDGSGGWDQRTTGELLPFSTRDVEKGTFIFKIMIPGNSTKSYYLRFSGESALDLPVFLYNDLGFHKRHEKKDRYFGFYMGATSIMMIISLFLFFQIRDATLLFYFLYLGTGILIFSNYSGLTEQYLWPNYPIWANRFFFVFYFLSHIFFLLFTRAFLNTSEHLKLFDKILVTVIIILTVSLVAGVFIPYKTGVQVLLSFALIYLLIALICGIVSYYKGVKYAGYYLLACAPVIISTTIIILLIINLIPSTKFFNTFLYVIPILKLFLLSIAIIGRIKVLQDEKQEISGRVNRIKDEFLANTSHELRTPLHGIIGITESLIEQKTRHNTPALVVDQLNIVMAAGRRLANLVNDILDVSKLKNREIILVKKSLDFKKLTDVVLTLCRPLTIGKDIELINEIPDTVAVVSGDENRLQQVLHNLVGNAIKFTEKGSVRVKAEQHNGRMRISVQDTGVGIPENQLKRIFLSFDQGYSNGSTYSQGAGLGLSIVRQLIHLHGGEVSASSEVGGGSVFSFDLEASSAPVDNDSALPLGLTRIEDNSGGAPVSSAPAANNGVKNFHILVVDDEPLNLQVVTNQLRDRYAQIEAVTSGAQALAAIEKNLPHLILLDIMMPKMSGFELCKILRERYPKEKIAIIFLTAKNQVTDLVEGFAMGANDYISKPFSQNELLTRVQYQLDSYQMANRLICLTNFSCSLSKIKELKQAFQSAFFLICEHLSFDYGVLAADGKVIDRFGKAADNVSAAFLFSDAEGTGDQIKLSRTRSTEMMRIQPRFFSEYTILIVKEKHQVFNDLDMAFVRNVLAIIKITRDNLRDIVSDARFMTSLSKIQDNLKSIIYLKSDRNYCQAVCNGEPGDSFEMRISIQKIQTFFKESELLKINRSTLINPGKVHSVKKVSKQKYCVLMMNNEEFTISRSLLKEVKQILDK